MTRKEFLKLLEARAKITRETFREKQQEYGVEDNVFYTVERGASIARVSPESFIFIQMAKHLAKLSKSCEMGDRRASVWDEPIRDCFVYLHFLDGLSSKQVALSDEKQTAPHPLMPVPPLRRASDET